MEALSDNQEVVSPKVSEENMGQSEDLESVSRILGEERQARVFEEHADSAQGLLRRSQPEALLEISS